MNKGDELPLRSAQGQTRQASPWVDRPKVRGGGDGPGIGFDVARTGVVFVRFVGFPSVGKWA